MKKKLAIIGAGIAGLTFANFVKKFSQHEFMIYEKEESLPLNEGYGIQLAINSIKILNKIDFAKIDKKHIFYPSGIDFYNIKKEKICNLDLTQFNSEDKKYTTLQRSTLIEFLKDEVYSQHLRFGKKIKEVSELKGKILIKFYDNTNDLVDFVIAADGIFSNTRSFFEKKKSSAKFQKAIAIRTIINSKNDLDINKNNISLLMGNNCHFVVYPINQSNDLNLVCVVRNKEFDPENIKSIINDKILIQNPKFKNVFEGDLKSWPLYSSPNILPSTNKKVFYIGDAFSGFLPTLAQGAGQSIESAHELFNLINSGTSEIQKEYFYERSKKTRIVRKRSNFNFFIFHLSSAIMQKIRNHFMKFLIKRKSFINSYVGKIYKN